MRLWLGGIRPWLHEQLCKIDVAVASGAWCMFGRCIGYAE